MSKKNRQYFKNKWLHGYIPLKQDYDDLFDSFLIEIDDAGLLATPGDAIIPIIGYDEISSSGTSIHFAREDHSHGSPATPVLSNCAGTLPITKIDSTGFLDKQTLIYSNTLGTFIPQMNSVAQWGYIIGSIDNQTDLINLFDEKSNIGHTHPDLMPLTSINTSTTGKYLSNDGTSYFFDTVNWGKIAGALIDQTDLSTALDGKSNINHIHSSYENYTTMLDDHIGNFNNPHVVNSKQVFPDYQLNSGKFAKSNGTDVFLETITINDIENLQNELNAKVNEAHLIDYSNPHHVTVEQISAIPLSYIAAANGVASLDSSGKVPANQIPSIAISDTFIVPSYTDLVTLTNAGTGDVGISTGESRTFILGGDGDYSILSNWIEIINPGNNLPVVPLDQDKYVLQSSFSEGLYWTKRNEFITRYSVGEKSYVTANGSGIVLSRSNNNFNITAPSGILALSMSIWVDRTVVIESFINIELESGCGCGIINSYDNLYVPSFQILIDEPGNRAYKHDVYGNFNQTYNVLTLTNIPSGSFWIKLTF